MLLPFVKILTLSLLAFTASSSAYAFTGQDEETPGYMALRYNRRSHIWSRLDAGFVDARVKTPPPGSVRYDRRLEGFSSLGFDAAFTARFGLRLNVKGLYVRQRQSQKDDAQSVLDQTQQTYTPSADLTFVTDQGLELFAGAEDQMSPAYYQKVASNNGTSTTHGHKVAVHSRQHHTPDRLWTTLWPTRAPHWPSLWLRG